MRVEHCRDGPEQTSSSATSPSVLRSTCEWEEGRKGRGWEKRERNGEKGRGWRERVRRGEERRGTEGRGGVRKEEEERERKEVKEVLSEDSQRSSKISRCYTMVEALSKPT